MSLPIVCLIATWRDGELLAEAVASAQPFVDAVVVLDGVYAGVLSEAATVGWINSEKKELDAARDAGAMVFPYWGGPPWGSEIAKRNALLMLGANVAPGWPYWALVLDADERLSGGEGLAAYLRWAEPPAPGLPRIEPDGTIWRAPSRLFQVTERTHYSQRSYWLSRGDAIVLDLAHEPWKGPVPVDTLPRVVHQWDLRPEWRKSYQHRWGRLLAAQDGHPSS